MSGEVRDLLGCCSVNDDGKYRFAANSFSTVSCFDSVDLSKLLFDLCSVIRKSVTIPPNTSGSILAKSIMLQNQLDFWVWEERCKDASNFDVSIVANTTLSGSVYDTTTEISITPTLTEPVYSWTSFDTDIINSDTTSIAAISHTWNFFKTSNSTTTFITKPITANTTFQSLEINDTMFYDVEIDQERHLRVSMKRENTTTTITGVSMVGACESNKVEVLTGTTAHMFFRDIILYDKIQNMFAKFGYVEKEYRVFNASTTDMILNVFVAEKCAAQPTPC